MAGHDLIVMGASAGGVEAIVAVVRALPADLPAAVLVVLHVPADSRSVLPQILERHGRLPASHPEEGESIRPGHIYVAPPNRHLLVGRGVVHLSTGPHENRVRPAIDPLFRSAALAYGARVIGVVLSGTLDDGTAGLVTIVRRGGLAVIQDPEDAAFPGMPLSALQHVVPDERLPVERIGAALDRLARLPARGAPGPPSDRLEEEVEVAESAMQGTPGPAVPGMPTGFACPECHGVLFELRDGELVRYRCRVGHAYGVESLGASQDEAVEVALWTALRALEEKADLSRRLQARADERGLTAAAGRFATQAVEAAERAESIRRVLLAEQPVRAKREA
jgi:two-component system, chemotaxis family, protein-glutamate methylesterase/glutaminase